MSGRSFKGAALLALSVVVPTGWWSGEAAAQQAGQQAAPEVATDEVIVIGRKRAESAQSVPVAVTPMSADRLERESITTTEQLVQKIPGVTLARVGAPFADQVSIRGQGGGRQINAEVSTGIFRNGAFIAGGNIGGANFSRLDLFDVERVEAYRGPQGATFGRNAIGGAVNVISNRPADAFSVSAEAAYGEKERYELRGVLNAPLSDVFYTRLGILHIDQNDGYFVKSLDGPVKDNEQATGGRVGFRFEPTATFDATLTLDYLEENTPALSPGTFNPQNALSNPFVEQSNTDSRFDRQEYSAILEFNTQLSFATLSGVSLYKNRQATLADDLDSFLNVAAPTLQNLVRRNTEDFTRWGQELRLVSNGDGPLNWVIGAEVLRLEGDNDVGVVGAPPPQASQNFRSVTASRDWSYAAYALLGADITERLNLTGELRYTNDDKKIDLSYTSFTGAGVATVTPATAARTFDNVSPVATVAYQAHDALNLYARYATGFRAGGFNNLIDDQTPARFGLAYQPEEARSYELGIKSSLFDRRLTLNLAAFKTDTDDIILNRTVVSGVRIINFVTNAGESEVLGIEGDFSLNTPVSWTGGHLNVDGSASNSESEFTAGVFKGFSVPYVRHWQASIATTYSQPLTDNLEIFVTHAFRGAWGGFEDQPTNRALDDYQIHDLRAGLRTGHLTLSAEYENAFDELFVTQRLSPTVSKISYPGRWMFRIAYRS